MAKHRLLPKIILPANFRPCIGIVQAIFNKSITDQLCTATTRCLDEYGIRYHVVEVPGCFEIPYALQVLAINLTPKYDALVALGCLIKGRTWHFEVIASAVSRAITDLIIKHHLPIGFGVITAQNAAHAQARVGLGYEAAYAALASLVSAVGMSVDKTTTPAKGK